MEHTSLEGLPRARRDRGASADIDMRRPALEVEMWHSYRSRLVAELAEVDRILDEVTASCAHRARWLSANPA
jgi:hypothetical protein